MVNQRLAPIGNTQCVGISFFHPGIAMRPLAKWPFLGFLKPELAEEIFVERAA